MDKQSVVDIACQSTVNQEQFVPAHLPSIITCSLRGLRRIESDTAETTLLDLRIAQQSESYDMALNRPHAARCTKACAGWRSIANRTRSRHPSSARRTISAAPTPGNVSHAHTISARVFIVSACEVGRPMWLRIAFVSMCMPPSRTTVEADASVSRCFRSDMQE